jgi:branched-chain amino acid transport system substrate-binding protein
MNSAAVTEAGNVNYPRDKMLGVWWSGAEPDVDPGRRQGRRATRR